MDGIQKSSRYGGRCSPIGLVPSLLDEGSMACDVCISQNNCNDKVWDPIPEDLNVSRGEVPPQLRTVFLHLFL